MYPSLPMYSSLPKKNVFCKECSRDFYYSTPEKSKNCIFCGSPYKCPYCLEEVEENRKTCNHCGAPVKMCL